jgi:hypothetical protein
MGVFNEFTLSKKKFEQDSLHINMHTGKISAELNMYKYRDKDTRQIVFYVPSLELTSYGADEEKAIEMIRFSIDNYLEFLVTLSTKKLEAELLLLKWKRNFLKNKEYSTAYVDVSGKLKNLNAVGDKVERLTIVAA